MAFILRDIFSEQHNRIVLLHRLLGYSDFLLNSMQILEDSRLRAEVQKCYQFMNKEHY
jgi:hypothetical protein